MSYTDSINETDLSKFETVTNIYPLLSQALEPGAKRMIANKIIENEVDLTQSHNTEIVFYKCYFKGKVAIRNATFQEDVTFNNCYFDEHFFLGDTVAFKKSFGLMNSSVRKIVVAIGTNFADAYFKLTACEEFGFQGVNFQSLELDFSNTNDTLNTFTLSHMNEFSEGEVRVSALSANFISITGNSKKTNIYLTNLFAGKISIDEYRNDGILRLSDINVLASKEDTAFVISNAYLGKAEFDSIDFTDFKHLYIGDSNIIDSSFVNVKWCKKIGAFDFFQKHISNTEEKILSIEKEGFTQLIKTARLRRDDDVITYYGKQREIYRQLKFAMGKQGDVINEQKFHALEMEAYDKSLLWSTSRWTKMILKLSQWTSDYGQSVNRPILWLLAIHFVLFSILLMFNFFPDLKFSSNPNWQGTKAGINYYFETINPFRKVETGQSFVIIDLLMRIWSSYMIYNFIRASRRFIK